ncbi:nucleotide exchange factor GrpE [bacterium]|nr:nucleotide exchange factor GrpE [bacterium]MBT4248758.1 nucleotide exchange factor GrpE [bacterium]MBT5733684.1 nucleotide exchange factor GrpE [bacterium]MBT6018295.1 nucleotide exchange factor GrpE [bacterium]MBT6776699.1 nucleotide exchange factor GrpE [bacterium]
MTEKKTAKTKKQTVKKKQVKKTSKPKATSLKLENEINVLKDKHIRLKAEFENFRKRKNKEISSLLQYDGESIIKEVLPIFDDLNRMVDSAESSNLKNENSLVDGINLLSSKIDRFLESKNIEPFGIEGERLDPQIHDAMLTQKDDKKEDNVILSVFEKGYKYHDKVIRHAKVVVNKK